MLWWNWKPKFSIFVPIHYCFQYLVLQLFLIVFQKCPEVSHAAEFGAKIMRPMFPCRLISPWIGGQAIWESKIPLDSSPSGWTHWSGSFLSHLDVFFCCGSHSRYKFWPGRASSCVQGRCLGCRWQTGIINRSLTVNYIRGRRNLDYIRGVKHEFAFYMWGNGKRYFIKSIYLVNLLLVI